MRRVARYVLSRPVSSGARRVARPTISTSRPVAKGSRVPVCPTFTFRPSRRRTPATTSCDVGPAGLSTSQRAAATAPQPPAPFGLAARWSSRSVMRRVEPGEQVVGGPARAEAGRRPVAAAALVAGDRRDVHVGVDRAQRHAPRAVRAGLAHQRRRLHPPHAAHDLDDALGVVAARRVEVVAGEDRREHPPAGEEPGVLERPADQQQALERLLLVQPPRDGGRCRRPASIIAAATRCACGRVLV